LEDALIALRFAKGTWLVVDNSVAMHLRFACHGSCLGSFYNLLWHIAVPAVHIFGSFVLFFDWLEGKGKRGCLASVACGQAAA
jgi:hypothetical protein